MSELKQLMEEAKADEEAGNLIPGGFDGIGELSDELESALKKLQVMVQDGMSEREQKILADIIEDALTVLIAERYKEA